ncbi:hypothetical protein [Roseibium aggregatum]|uniref:Uncharacterized protein n=1 Tax=Roseibium aggregatum TaxID=187304 RepID=A0A939J4M6_9HYPH|nr:hypothetical protein [Roseibium aggregatum]MBN9671340.1 hypothetical protein [Roseibium aggregatum]
MRYFRHLALLIALQAPWTAAAAPLEDYFFGFNTCYGRSYPLEHLNKNPDQQVIEMAISHFPAKQNLLGMESPYQPYPDTPRLVLKLDVWMRGKDNPWQENAICGADGDRLLCRIGCDGGAFHLTARPENRLLLTLDRELYFTQCDAGDAVLNRTKADSAFLLYPIPQSHCRDN